MAYFPASVGGGTIHKATISAVPSQVGSEYRILADFAPTSKVVLSAHCEGSEVLPYVTGAVFSYYYAFRFIDETPTTSKTVTYYYINSSDVIND